MDAGWTAEVNSPLENIVKFIETKERVKLMQWAKSNSFICKMFKRDTGQYPPNPITLRVDISNKEPLTCCLKAWDLFGFANIGEDFVAWLKLASKRGNNGWQLEISFTDTEIVGIRSIVPNPTDDDIKELCNLSGGNYPKIQFLAYFLQSRGPTAVELGVRFSIHAEILRKLVVFEGGTRIPSIQRRTAS